MADDCGHMEQIVTVDEQGHAGTVLEIEPPRHNDHDENNGTAGTQINADERKLSLHLRLSAVHCVSSRFRLVLRAVVVQFNGATLDSLQPVSAPTPQTARGRTARSGGRRRTRGPTAPPESTSHCGPAGNTSPADRCRSPAESRRSADRAGTDAKSARISFIRADQLRRQTIPRKVDRRDRRRIRRIVVLLLDPRHVERIELLDHRLAVELLFERIDFVESARCDPSAARAGRRASPASDDPARRTPAARLRTARAASPATAPSARGRYRRRSRTSCARGPCVRPA